MNYTNPAFEKKLREHYSKLTPQEKFGKMLCLCQTAREIIKSQLSEKLTDQEKRKIMFSIYYKQDFSEEAFEQLLKKIFPE